jgi:chromosome segregation ATPase
MKEKIESRLQELNGELERVLTSREDLVMDLQTLSARRQELSVIIAELYDLLEEPTESSSQSPESSQEKS